MRDWGISTEIEREDTHVTRSARVTGALLACIFVIGLNPADARAQQATTAAEAGMGMLASLSTLVYGPVKIVYATGGLIFGGFAWVLSGGNHDVMNAVFTPSVRGDYVVTPAHLRGEKPLEFIGRDPAYRP